MIAKLIARYRAWAANADREYERSRSIDILVRIPYTTWNELVLRGMKVGQLTVDLPVALERVEVRCVGNPDWRK
jgi:hypothetical protein